MFNNEDILMGSLKKPIVFELIYAGSPHSIRPTFYIEYTDPTTGQKVTHSMRMQDSYSFPCAIGDTVKIYDSWSGGRAPELTFFKFFNGVDVSPTTGEFEGPNGECTFTITGKSPFLNYY